MVPRLIDLARDSLFRILPWTCLACEGPIADPREIAFGLCQTCQAGTLALLPPQCTLCGISLSSEDEYCLSCRGFGTALPCIARLRSLFLYEGTGPEILHAYKHSGGRPIAAFFAQALIPLLTQLWQPGTGIITVPSLPANIRKRGFDQMSALLRCLPRSFRECASDKFLRRQRGAAQKTLNKAQRVENLQGRIAIQSKAKLPSRVILLDDVCTTGATLSACAQVLTAAGCREIVALTLFRD